MNFRQILMIAATQGGGGVTALVAGPELWPQPTFAASTGLTLTRCSIASNTLSFSGTDLAGTCVVTAPPTFVAGQQYQYSVTIAANPQGDALALSIGGVTVGISSGSPTGVKTGTVTIPGTPTAILQIRNADNFSPGTATITACSVKLLS